MISKGAVTLSSSIFTLVSKEKHIYCEVSQRLAYFSTFQCRHFSSLHFYSPKIQLHRNLPLDLAQLKSVPVFNRSALHSITRHRLRLPQNPNDIIIIISVALFLVSLCRNVASWMSGEALWAHSHSAFRNRSVVGYHGKCWARSWGVKPEPFPTTGCERDSGVNRELGECAPGVGGKEVQQQTVFV